MGLLCPIAKSSSSYHFAYNSTCIAKLLLNWYVWSTLNGAMKSFLYSVVEKHRFSRFIRKKRFWALVLSCCRGIELILNIWVQFKLDEKLEMSLVADIFDKKSEATNI